MSAIFNDEEKSNERYIRAYPDEALRNFLNGPITGNR